MIDRNRSEHIILGIDPGTLFMGHALLHTVGQQVEILEFGAYDVHKLEGQYPRLQKEFFFIQDLIDRYHPSALAIETQFVDKNPQTMIKIVHAQGVAIAAALSKDVPIYEYSPMKIKMAITGNGHSSKQQVAGMLQRFLAQETGCHRRTRYRLLSLPTVRDAGVGRRCEGLDDLRKTQRTDR